MSVTIRTSDLAAAMVAVAGECGGRETLPFLWELGFSHEAAEELFNAAQRVMTDAYHGRSGVKGSMRTSAATADTFLYGLLVGRQLAGRLR